MRISLALCSTLNFLLLQADTACVQDFPHAYQQAIDGPYTDKGHKTTDQIRPTRVIAQESVEQSIEQQIDLVIKHKEALHEIPHTFTYHETLCEQTHYSWIDRIKKLASLTIDGVLVYGSLHSLCWALEQQLYLQTRTPLDAVDKLILTKERNIALRAFGLVIAGLFYKKGYGKETPTQKILDKLSKTIAGLVTLSSYTVFKNMATMLIKGRR